MDYKNQKDYRTLNIKNTGDKQWFDNTCAKPWIEEAELEMSSSGMHQIWERNVLYAEGQQVPVGHSSDALRQYIRTNSGRLNVASFKVTKDQNDKIYVVDNKIPDVLDGMIGEFATGDKSFQVKNDDNPRNNRIEWVVDKYLEIFEKRKRYQKSIKNACIRKWAKFGLAWILPEYDPYINIPLGDITFDVLHPKDILVDPMSQRDYYVDARYVIRKKRLELNKARQYLKENFGVEEKKVKADTEYERYHTYNKTNIAVASQDKFVTFYYIYFKNDYLEDAQLEGAGKVKERVLWSFEALFVPGEIGTVWYRRNPHVDPRRIDGYAFRPKPLVGSASEIRLYPQSIVEKLANIQDIINITKSLILDRERQKAKIWGFVMSKLKDNYGDLFKEWVKYGGLLPVDSEGDMNNNVKFLDLPNVSPETNVFLEMMEKSFRDNGPKREVLTGRLPDQKSDTPSGTAIQKLMEANTKNLSEAYDAMEWQDNEVAQDIYNIMATEMSEEDFVDFEDAKQGDPKYIPVNAMMSLAEYEQHLIRMYPNMDPIQAAELFEEKNDVEIHYVTKDQNGQPLPGQDIKEKQSVVFINMLTNPEGDKRFNMDIKVEIDFDAEKDEQEDKLLARDLRARGEIALEDYYDMLGGRFEANKEKMLENLAKEKQVLELGQMVLERGPEFAQRVQQEAAVFDAVNEASKGEKAKQAGITQ